MIRILVTSVGRRTYFIDYLKEIDNVFVAVCNSDYTMAMQAADDSFISPKIYDEGYIDSIIEYAENNNIDTIISLFDIDLLVLAENESRFTEKGIRLILAPLDSVKICNDKWLTYQFFKKIGVSTPKTWIDVNIAIEELNNHYPVIVKPRWGMGSKSIYIANNELELNVFYKKVSQEIFDSYLKYESSLTKESPVVIQEFIKGEEYGLDIVNDLTGKYITTFAKKKCAMRAGETDLGLTVNSNRFIFNAQQISENINHKVILSADCIVSDDINYFIELNCRFSGHYPVSHCAGVNLVVQMVEWLKGKETNFNLLAIEENVEVVKELIPVRLK